MNVSMIDVCLNYAGLLAYGLIASVILSCCHLGETVLCYNCVSNTTPECGTEFIKPHPHMTMMTTSTTHLQTTVSTARFAVNTSTTESKKELAPTVNSSSKSDWSDQDHIVEEQLNVTTGRSRETRDNYNGASGVVGSSGGGDSRDGDTGAAYDDMIVKCPGWRCLKQIVRTVDGDIIVRTCDVTSIPTDTCNSVTQVLGMRLSVVCACKGNLCNTSSRQVSSPEALIALVVLIAFAVPIAVVFPGSL